MTPVAMGTVMDTLPPSSHVSRVLARHPSHATGTGSRREAALSAWL